MAGSTKMKHVVKNADQPLTKRRRHHLAWTENKTRWPGRDAYHTGRLRRPIPTKKLSPRNADLAVACENNQAKLEQQLNDLIATTSIPVDWPSMTTKERLDFIAKQNHIIQKTSALHAEMNPTWTSEANATLLAQDDANQSKTDFRRLLENADLSPETTKTITDLHEIRTFEQLRAHKWLLGAQTLADLNGQTQTLLRDIIQFTDQHRDNTNQTIANFPWTEFHAFVEEKNTKKEYACVPDATCTFTRHTRTTQDDDDCDVRKPPEDAQLAEAIMDAFQVAKTPPTMTGGFRPGGSMSSVAQGMLGAVLFFRHYREAWRILNKEGFKLSDDDIFELSEQIPAMGIDSARIVHALTPKNQRSLRSRNPDGYYAEKIRSKMAEKNGISNWYCHLKGKLNENGIWRVDHNRRTVGNVAGIYQPMFDCLVKANLFLPHEGVFRP